MYILPRRVKRFYTNKKANSHPENINGDSISYLRSKPEYLSSDDNKTDLLSNADSVPVIKSAVHLDNLNLKIIEELLNNGDIKSSEIASRLKIPLSTIQRRRATLEKFDILKKNYSLDVTKLGLRVAEVSISTKKGSSRKVLDEIYNRHRKYITDMSLRVGNPDTNISFRIVYKNSSRLFNLLEEIKGNQMVDKVDWSEYITEKKNNQSSFSDLLSL
jgi:DNA-binding Lrp family transcriptional regulator